jgi:hypothetical protein
LLEASAKAGTNMVSVVTFTESIRPPGSKPGANAMGDELVVTAANLQVCTMKLPATAVHLGVSAAQSPVTVSARCHKGHGPLI